MAGYSKKALTEKLGMKSGMRVYFSKAPPAFFKLLGELPGDIQLLEKAGKNIDFIHHFTKEKNELAQEFAVLKDSLSQKGILWISWPKGASKVPTDLNGDIVRAIGLQNGLVDIKVCAVDEVWSGLKFVYRVKDRKG